MNQNFRYRQFSGGNPLANILVVIAGIFIIGISLALGLFVFLGLAGFVLLMAAVMSVRNWWARRRFKPNSSSEEEEPRQTTVYKQIIEGEYQEVRRPDKEPPGA